MQNKLKDNLKKIKIPKKPFYPRALIMIEQETFNFKIIQMLNYQILEAKSKLDSMNKNKKKKARVCNIIAMERI